MGSSFFAKNNTEIFPRRGKKYVFYSVKVASPLDLTLVMPTVIKLISNIIKFAIIPHENKEAFKKARWKYKFDPAFDKIKKEE